MRSLISLLLLTTFVPAAWAGGASRVLFIRGGPGTGGFFSGGADSHLSDVFDQSTGNGNTGFGELRLLLEADGFVVDQVIEGPVTNNTKIDLDAVGLSQYDVVVFGSNNADYNAADAELLRRYLCEGGAALFISDANWGGDWGDAPTSDQTFLTPLDLIMNQDGGTYSVSRAAGDFVIAGQDMGGHPILAGPDGALGTADDVDEFDGEGVSPISLANLLPGVSPVVLARAKQVIHKNDSSGSGSFVAPTDDDGSLVALEYGRGRVAGAFDRNTFFNQNGAGTDLTRFDNAQLARNLFGWLADADGPSYGDGCAGTGGTTPELALLGCPRPGDQVALSLDGALGGAPALLLFGVGAGQVPLPGGCALLFSTLLPVSVPLTLPGNGALLLPVQIPANTQVGSVRLQVVVADAGAAGGVAASNGVAVEVF